MEELKMIKGKSVTIPRMVSRYSVVFYTQINGWQFDNSCYTGMHTTPESALESFLSGHHVTQEDNDRRPLYYKVIELDLEIPASLDLINKL